MTHQKWCIVQQALNFSDMEIGAIIDDFQNMTGINKAAGHVEWDAILGYDPRLANSIGTFGWAAPWGNLSGGAQQMTTKLSYAKMLELGIIRELIDSVSDGLKIDGFQEV